jgi:hypothetical protein
LAQQLNLLHSEQNLLRNKIESDVNNNNIPQSHSPRHSPNLNHTRNPAICPTETTKFNPRNDSEEESSELTTEGEIHESNALEALQKLTEEERIQLSELIEHMKEKKKKKKPTTPPPLDRFYDPYSDPYSSDVYGTYDGFEDIVGSQDQSVIKQYLSTGLKCTAVGTQVSDSWCTENCACRYCQGCQAGMCGNFCKWADENADAKMPATNYCKDKKIGQYLWPGTKCKEFVSCEHGRQYVSPCMPGTRFNKLSGYCDYENMFTCEETQADVDLLDVIYENVGGDHLTMTIGNGDKWDEPNKHMKVNEKPKKKKNKDRG